MHGNSKKQAMSILQVSPGRCSTILHKAPKYANEKVHYFGLPYDYCSVTHAGKYDYHGQPSPSSGQPCWIKTLNEVNCVVNDNHVIQIGQRFGLSDLDKETIRRRYNCRGML